MNKDIYDVVVIGGGPAGMMAATYAATRGAKVLLLEKNSGVGKKLLITGGGRCNVTNAQYDIRKFLSKYKDSDKYLFSAFTQFNVKHTIDFFHTNNMQTKVESENRVFPISDNAQSVWNVLVESMKQAGVEVQTNAQVSHIKHQDKKITGIVLKNKRVIVGNTYILATGGTSRPETGSTGDGFIWLRDLGHNIIPSNYALVPIALKDMWTRQLSGVVLRDIKLTTFQNNQKQEVHKGKLLFTHFGISGPTILNMSKDIGELLKYGDVEIHVDLLPNLDHGMINEKLQNLFKTDHKKKIKNSLGTLIPPSLVSPLLNLTAIDQEKINNAVSREERMKLIEIIKNIPLHVSHLLGSDKAVVSSGGVDLNEIDFKTMKSTLITNLYIVGDVLNIDRPSGGYSLQLCWTTGYVAGNSASTQSTNKN